MSPDWQEIYRSYTPDELAAEIIALKRQKTLFTQQSIGNKSASKDLRELKDQLHSATRVQNERLNAHRPDQSTGVMNFSGFQA